MAFLSLLIALPMQSQENQEQNNFCGTDLLTQGDQHTRLAVSSSFTRSFNATYTIPTVVHIIHDGGTENISEAQVISAIEQVNCKLNGQFGGDDSEIELRLATVDPDGNCTNGINRVQNNFPDAIYATSCSYSCGQDKYDLANLGYWNKDQYLNIWVVRDIRSCDLQCSESNVIGYANYPSSSGIDGIVIDNNYFGIIGSFNGSNSKNVLAHELGHYLDLFHPWGDDGLDPCERCGDPNDCSNTGDLICDTAPCKVARGGSIADCNTTPTSCPDDCDEFVWPEPQYYPFDNFMSYGQVCQFRFTPDQITRMHCGLEMYRSSQYSLSNISATAPINLTITQENFNPILCGDEEMGSIDISVSGGSGSYSYLWSNGEITEDIVNVSGNVPHSVLVSDNNSSVCGDIGFETFHLENLSLDADVLNAYCNGSGLSSIDLTVNNSTGTNTYSWTGPYGFNSTNEDLSDLIPHSSIPYTVTVITDGGCILTQEFPIHLINQFGIDGEVIFEDCLNPNLASIYPQFIGSNVYSITYEWQNSDGVIISNDEVLEDITPGVYTLIATSQYGCTAQHDFTVISGYSDPDLLIITGNLTISGYHQFIEGIEIMPGAEVEISAGNLFFAPVAGIIIHPGGKLIVNNSSALRSLECAHHWRGIEVLGNPNYSQEGTDANQQGQFSMYDSWITDALIGVSNYDRQSDIYNPVSSGGIIHVENSMFINCRTAVALGKFTNNYNGTAYPLNSRFINSNFTWNAVYQRLSPLHYPMIDLFKVRDVEFKGCSFLNQSHAIFYINGRFKRGAAIYGVMSSINMDKGCDETYPFSDDCELSVPSKMNGFMYGIVLDEGKNSQIRRTDFSNFRSIWINHHNHARYTENNFSNISQGFLDDIQNNFEYAFPDDSWQAHYGMYLEYSSSFWIEGNNYDFSGLTEPNAGLIIRASGETFNEVYDNNFQTCQYAIVAYDDNRGEEVYEGLKIECNSFTNDYRDMLVYYTTADSPPVEWNWGVSTSQGIPVIGDGISAGNEFINPNAGDTNDENGYNIDNFLSSVTYAKVNDENLVESYGILEVIVENAHLCETNLMFANEDQFDLAMDHKALADIHQDQLDQLVDGGNTYALMLEVILSDYSEALDLYYELMGKSPGLSEEVMLEAIEREYTLPPVLLVLILQSNPSAAKSGDIQKKLDDRFIPLDEYQRAMIDQGKELLSSKEKLQSKVSFHLSKYRSFLNRSAIQIIDKEKKNNALSAYQAMISGHENIEDYYMLADFYLDKGDLVSAQDALDMIETTFDKSIRKDLEYQDYLFCYSVLFRLEQASNVALTDTEKDELYSIAYKHSNSCAGKARSLLVAYDGMHNREILKLPYPNEKSVGNKGRKGKLSPNYDDVSIFPNPAHDHLIIQSMELVTGTPIEIFNIKGELVLRTNSKNNYQMIIDVRDFSAGIYTLSFTTINGEKKSKLIEIIK